LTGLGASACAAGRVEKKSAAAPAIGLSMVSFLLG